MSEATWPTALAFVLAQEGGYSDDPRDPGGATNLGITLDELTRWRGTAVTKDDVRSLGRAEAAAIYHSSYWLAVRCPDMPPGVDLMLFDMAVNTGCRRATLMLQDTAAVAPDGIIGPRTLAAAAVDPGALVGQLAQARDAFYRSLSTFHTFGSGWLSRVEDAEKAALALIAAHWF